MSLNLRINQVSFSQVKAENLNKILRLISESTADIDIFPEYCMGVPNGELDRGFVEENAESAEGKFAHDIVTATESRGSAVVFTMFLKEGKAIYNAAILARAGRIETVYKKIHLFDAYGYEESALFASGNSLALAEVGPFKVGLAVCFDLRFPELFRAMAYKGANMFVVPSGWYRGKYKITQWKVLSGARAHENVSYLVAADQTLPHFIGHSLVTSPMGYAIAELKAEQASFTVKLDLEEIQAARRLLPTALLSRRDLYSKLEKDA